MPVNSVAATAPKITILATANQLAFLYPNMALAAFQANIAASRFAASFVAAALSQQQFRIILDSFAAGMVARRHSLNQTYSLWLTREVPLSTSIFILV
jgi:hypothetical protein